MQKSISKLGLVLLLCGFFQRDFNPLASYLFGYFGAVLFILFDRD